MQEKGNKLFYARPNRKLCSMIHKYPRDFVLRTRNPGRFGRLPAFLPFCSRSQGGTSILHGQAGFRSPLKRTQPQEPARRHPQLNPLCRTSSPSSSRRLLPRGKPEKPRSTCAASLYVTLAASGSGCKVGLFLVGISPAASPRKMMRPQAVFPGPPPAAVALNIIRGKQPTPRIAAGKDCGPCGFGKSWTWQHYRRTFLRPLRESWVVSTHCLFGPCRAPVTSQNAYLLAAMGEVKRLFLSSFLPLQPGVGLFA